MSQLILLCKEGADLIIPGKFYIQINGDAMVGPIGPLLAIIFMSKIETVAREWMRKTILHKRNVNNNQAISEKGKGETLCNSIEQMRDNIYLNKEVK